VDVELSDSDQRNKVKHEHMNKDISYLAGNLSTGEDLELNI
jgi:hypothetical protein